MVYFRLKWIALVFCLFAFPLNVFAAESHLPTIHIAFVSDGGSPGLMKMRRAIEKEIRDLLEGEFVVTFSKENEFLGQFTQKSVQKKLDEAEENPSIDIVIALGVLSSQEVTQMKDLNKPSFAPFIINTEYQGTPRDGFVSGVTNLNYQTFPIDIQRDLNMLQTLSGFHKGAMIVSESVNQAMPQIAQNVKKQARLNGMEIVIVPVNDQTIVSKLHSLPDDIEAAYISPLIEMHYNNIHWMFDYFKEQKIPTFSLFGQGYMEAGALASLSPDSDLPRLSRRLALNIQRTLLGENPKNLPVEVPAGNTLILNMDTAEQIDLWPAWDLLLEAVQYWPPDHLLEQKKESLPDLAVEGSESNLSLRAAKQLVFSGQEEVVQARSKLRPQVGVNSVARMIDKDRALLSLGTEPQSAWFGSIGGEQVLYSSELWGNVKAQAYRQRARWFSFHSETVNTIAAISIAYFNLMRAETLEKIQRNNLRLSRIHYRMASEREKVGVANANEVLRWESAISSDQAEVSTAHYQVKSAQTLLNQLLNRPQNQPLFLQSVSLNEAYWVMLKQWVNGTINDDQTLEHFNEFIVNEGLCYSPVLKELSEEARAQSEILGIRDRAFWSPTIKAIAEVRNRFFSGGSKEVPSQRIIPNTTDWVAGFDLTFPLYEGGNKSASLRKAYTDLKRICIQRQALAEEIERQIRSTIYQATASYFSIHLARSAAKTATENLRIVSAGYNKGNKTILDLLDAQNQSLIADLLTTNAVYDFLIDLIQVQQSVGRYDFLFTFQERQDWLQRVERSLR